MFQIPVNGFQMVGQHIQPPHSPHVSKVMLKPAFLKNLQLSDGPLVLPGYEKINVIKRLVMGVLRYPPCLQGQLLVTPAPFLGGLADHPLERCKF